MTDVQKVATAHVAIPSAKELARSVDSVIDLSDTSPSDCGPLMQASGRRHTLCVRDGRAHAWGGSSLIDEGATFIAHLGTGEAWGDVVPAPRPMLFAQAAATRAMLVATGDLHSLVLCSDGRVYSCGAGWEGPLGHGDASCEPALKRIDGLADRHVVHIAAGGAHSLAVCSDGALYSWGWGRHGQLGHGDTASAFAPRTVDGLASVHISEARAPPHPHGARRANILPPRPLPPSSTCHQVSAGPTHSLARVSSTELYAFGRGASLTSASPDAREGGAAHADGGECRLLPVRVDELDDVPEPLIA